MLTLRNAVSLPAFTQLLWTIFDADDSDAPFRLRQRYATEIQYASIAVLIGRLL